jgi:hypothetical protein
VNLSQFLELFVLHDFHTNLAQFFPLNEKLLFFDRFMTLAIETGTNT